jgi:uncharacterized protein with PQ loop repeat
MQKFEYMKIYTKKDDDELKLFMYYKLNIYIYIFYINYILLKIVNSIFYLILKVEKKFKKKKKKKKNFVI